MTITSENISFAMSIGAVMTMVFFVWIYIISKKKGKK
jgi:hypothetical protein